MPPTAVAAAIVAAQGEMAGLFEVRQGGGGDKLVLERNDVGFRGAKLQLIVLLPVADGRVGHRSRGGAEGVTW